MIRLFTLIYRAIMGIRSASISTSPRNEYFRGIQGYSKAYFDEEYQFQYYKRAMENMPRDIAYYQSHLNGKTLRKKTERNYFEIYETHILSDVELALNVRMVYADFEMTGIYSKKNSVVTKNEFFILLINKELDQLEMRTSIYNNITEKNIKSDFSEYAIKYVIKQKKLEDSGELEPA